MIALVVCLIVAATAEGRQPFRAGIDIVSLPVTVTDRDGRIVTGLSNEDFDVIEDGVRQEVTLFSSEPQPLAISVIVDFSTSMRGERRTAALAAVRTVGLALAPVDQWSLFVFADKVARVTEWATFARDDGARMQHVETGGGTRLFEAVVEVQKQLQTAPHRKRALLVISDGNDTAAMMDAESEEPVGDVGGGEDRAIRALRNGEALLYAVGMDWPYGDRRRPNANGSTRVDRRSLARLAEPTGGAVWMARTSDDLQRAAAQLMTELRQQYTLGYTPAKPPDGKYRKVRVTTKDPNYVVRSRAGYVAARR